MQRLILLFLFASQIGFSQSTVVTGVSNPWGLAVSNGVIYIGEHGDGQVTSYDTNDSNASVQTIAGGFSGLSALGVVGDELFIGERNSYDISKVDLTATSVDVVACTTLEFPPVGFAVYDGYLYTAQREGNSISRINLADGCPTTFSTPVGGLEQSYGIAIDGDIMYVTQSDLGTVSSVDLSTGKFVVKELVTGLTTPGGMTVVDNILYIADFGSGNLESVDLTAETPELTTVLTGLNGPLAVASENGVVYIAEFNGNRISRYPELSNIEEVRTELPLSISPVPADQTITVTFDSSKAMLYQLLSVSGKIVQQGIVQSGVAVDINQLDAGTYIFRVDGYSNQRIIKL